MDFLVSSENLDGFRGSRKEGPFFVFFTKGNVQGRELFYESDELFIISDANLSFIKSIKDNPTVYCIEKNISSLNNGFVIVINKVKNNLLFFNDIFGFYSVFYIHNKSRNFYLSNDYRLLLKFSESEINPAAIIDLLLFNYILNERTLMRDITRLKGGSEFSMKNADVSIKNPNNFAYNFSVPIHYNKYLPGEAGEILSAQITSEISSELQTILTMSGGFDSRVLLAASKHAGVDVSTITFGQKGSIEQETIAPFIDSFVRNHTFYCLDDNYLKDIEHHLSDFLSCNIESPSAQDMVHYSYIKDNLGHSNLVAGYMGGELMTGQSLGSRVTFTGFAYDLLRSNTLGELAACLNDKIEITGFIDKREFKMFRDEYLAGLENYLNDGTRLRIIRFLINEKYSKFFGRINNLFRNHSNLVIPFMTYEYLNYLLNSQRSILRTRILNNPATVTLNARIAYSKMIKYLYDPLTGTRLDRLYRIKDLSEFYRIPLAVGYYFLNHIFDKNKKKFVRPHHYDLWYRNIKMEDFGDFDSEFLDRIIKKDQFKSYNELSIGGRKIFINLVGINLGMRLIKEARG